MIGVEVKAKDDDKGEEDEEEEEEEEGGETDRVSKRRLFDTCIIAIFVVVCLVVSLLRVDLISFPGS